MFEKKMEENVDFNKTYAAFRDSEEVFFYIMIFL